MQNKFISIAMSLALTATVSGAALAQEAQPTISQDATGNPAANLENSGGSTVTQTDAHVENSTTDAFKTSNNDSGNTNSQNDNRVDSSITDAFKTSANDSGNTNSQNDNRVDSSITDSFKTSNNDSGNTNSHNDNSVQDAFKESINSSDLSSNTNSKNDSSINSSDLSANTDSKNTFHSTGAQSPNLSNSAISGSAFVDGATSSGAAPILTQSSISDSNLATQYSTGSGSPNLQDSEIGAFANDHSYAWQGDVSVSGVPGEGSGGGGSANVISGIASNAILGNDNASFTNVGVGFNGDASTSTVNNSQSNNGNYVLK